MNPSFAPAARFSFWSLVVFGSLAASSVQTASAASLVDVTAPTTSWTVIRYTNNNPDPAADQQTGSRESDIVGNVLQPAAFTMFGDAGTPGLTDGTLGFRIRVSEDSNPSGFKAALFVGLDANGDGALDLFLGVNNSGSADTIALWNPGTGANTGPSTTSIVSPPMRTFVPLSGTNYQFAPVTAINDPTAGGSLNLDGGTTGNDYFLSFSVPFFEVVTALGNRGITGVNQNSNFTYVIATSNQDNSLNQDLNGIGAGFTNSPSTFASLGIVTNPISASGNAAPLSAVPEPSTWVAAAALLGVVGAARPRRRA